VTAIVTLFNAAATFLFGLVYAPLKWLGPFGSLAVISFLAGILLVWIFGKVSNQSAIERTRNRLSSELIGLRLFKEDLKVFFGIQFQVLMWTLKYLKHSLVPMLILMVPTIVILIQLNLHYGFRPLRIGERALVKVKLRDAAAAGNTQITLKAPTNVEIETPPVHVEQLGEVCWRVRGVTSGEFDLELNDGTTLMGKKMSVGGRLEGVSTMRNGESWLSRLLYPGEAGIPQKSSFASIEILYPKLDIQLLGWRLNWLLVFLILSLVFGYAFKGVLGVKI
jgi:hypothetical protein